MLLEFGDPAPSFHAVTRTNPSYVFDMAAGRYLLMAMIGDGDDTFIAKVEAFIAEQGHLLTGDMLAFFGVLRDPDRWSRRVDHIPGARWMLDRDGAATAGFGLADDTAWSGWILIDPTFRILLTLQAAETEQLSQFLPKLRAPAQHAGVELVAPVLILPRVFEPELCQMLITAYEAEGGRSSGFMRQVDGRTVEIHDASHKIRRDILLPDGPLCDAVQARIRRRLVPQITRAFQFTATRMERNLVACYDAADQGFFRPHRDNTMKGTDHRRFAVTINLNAEQYEGGDLRFPEFGPRTYRAPTGGAVVFSCSLLHEALPVTAGKRYAFLPFLYDEAAALIRAQSASLVGAEGYHYEA